MLSLKNCSFGLTIPPSYFILQIFRKLPKSQFMCDFDNLCTNVSIKAELKEVLQYIFNTILNAKNCVKTHTCIKHKTEFVSSETQYNFFFNLCLNHDYLKYMLLKLC